MKQNTLENMSRDLQIYLIQRFVLAVIMLYLMESVVNILYNTVFSYILLDVLDAGSLIKTDDFLLRVVQVILIVIWMIGGWFIPESFDNFISEKLSYYLDLSLNAPEFVSRYGSGMTDIYYLSIAAVAFLQFILMLLPIVFVSWWYIGCVKRKTAELHQYEMDMKLEQDRRRNLLFSDIVHDVKTPITTVAGYSRALLDGMVTDPIKEHEYLQAIHGKSMRVSELITMLFEFVKLDSDGFSLHPETADLAELVRENVIMLFSDFEDKGLELEFELTEDICPAQIDKIQMSRVVTNLLSNTIRYLKSGDRVKVSLEVFEPTPRYENGYYRIAVTDDGIAIEESLVDTIFDPFTRADSARSTVSGGSGLGLSIAHKIAEMHGGELLLLQPCEEGYTKAFVIIVPRIGKAL